MKAIRKEDGTWCTVDDDSDILQHYGVKGMKWHHHKDRDNDSIKKKRNYVFVGPDIDAAKSLGTQILGRFKTKPATDSASRAGVRVLSMFYKNRKIKEHLIRRGTITKDGTRYTSYSSYTGYSYKN